MILEIFHRVYTKCILNGKASHNLGFEHHEIIFFISSKTKHIYVKHN